MRDPTPRRWKHPLRCGSSCAAVVLLLCAGAHAGLSTGVVTPVDSSVPGQSVALPDGLSEPGWGDPPPVLPGLSELSPPAPFSLLTSHFSLDTSAPVARELPPPPGSATLVLSGLLTLGACGAVRSIRHANWAALPDWYQEHAPDRVGAATVYDLLFDAPQVCWFAPPVDDGAAGLQPPRFPQCRRELPLRCSSQTTPLAAAPRGPPDLLS